MKDSADGVGGDVLYTTPVPHFWLKDAGLQADHTRVYGDWLAEFVSYAHRDGGTGDDLRYDPKAGARELSAAVGVKGAMIWCSPPEERPYSSDHDPFWAAARNEDADQPARDYRHGVEVSGTGAGVTCARRYRLRGRRSAS
jgi:hypothetical protein